MGKRAVRTNTVARQKARNRTSTKWSIRPVLQSLPLHEANLYEAIVRYVQHLGGGAVVIGGIEVQQWPDDPKGKYRVAVSVLGRVPEFAKRRPK